MCTYQNQVPYQIQRLSYVLQTQPQWLNVCGRLNRRSELLATRLDMAVQLGPVVCLCPLAGVIFSLEAFDLSLGHDM